MYTDQAAAMCTTGYAFDALAERIRNCAWRLEASLDQIRGVQSIDWESPAGEAFRQCMYEHLINVGHLQDNVAGLVPDVRRLADLAALEESVRKAGAAG